MGKVQQSEAGMPQTFNAAIPGDYTFRFGQSLDPKETASKSINIVGTLPAPFQFLSGKKALAGDVDNIHLKIFNADGKIELVVQDQNPYTTHTIVGKLTEDTRLLEWAINSTKRWSVRDFVNFIKARRFHFTQGDDCTKMIGSLNNWNAKIETIIQEHRDDKTGASLSHLEKRVEKEKGLVDSFSLTLPIFQGYPKLSFKVEIGVEPTANSVQLFLMSEDLFRFIDENREALMQKELKNFDQYTFSKVVIS